MSERLFKDKLNAIKSILLKANGISSEDRKLARAITDPEEVKTVYAEVLKLQKEGHSDEEIISIFAQEGVDASTLFN